MKWHTLGKTTSKVTLFVYSLIAQGVCFKRIEKAVDFAELAVADAKREVKLANNWVAGAAGEIAQRLEGGVLKFKGGGGITFGDAPVRRRGRHPKLCYCDRCKARLLALHQVSGEGTIKKGGTNKPPTPEQIEAHRRLGPPKGQGPIRKRR